MKILGLLFKLALMAMVVCVFPFALIIFIAAGAKK